MSRPSLRTRVLRHVLPSLAVTWLAGTMVAIAIALLFAQRALDRSMLDDAYLLASRVRAADAGALRLDLTPGEIAAVLFDQAETVFYCIREGGGRVVSGRAGLPAASGSAGGYRFGDIDFGGQRLRAVTLHRDQPSAFEVTVAETTHERDALLRQLFVYSLVPQLLLLAALAWWLRRAISGDIEPLASLERAVGDRDANDLAPVEVHGTTRDVESLAGAINLLLARLERSVRAQRELASNIAHELRTPLAGIRALAAYGLSRDDPAAWREQLAAIAQSEARATAMIDKLLELAVAHEAESRLTLAPVRLDELVRDAALRFLARADAAGVDLGARGIDAQVWVEGDPTMLEGILNNLIDNALRYGASGPDAPTITVSLERDGADVVLAVQDNGASVPGEGQARLVERGAQGETGQLVGQGAGLGLALVSQYARLMKGRMRLAGGPQGRGWVSEVRFPARAAPP